MYNVNIGQPGTLGSHLMEKDALVNPFKAIPAFFRGMGARRAIALENADYKGIWDLLKSAPKEWKSVSRADANQFFHSAPVNKIQQINKAKQVARAQAANVGAGGTKPVTSSRGNRKLPTRDPATMIPPDEYAAAEAAAEAGAKPQSPLLSGPWADKLMWGGGGLAAGVLGSNLLSPRPPQEPQQMYSDQQQMPGYY